MKRAFTPIVAIICLFVGSHAFSAEGTKIRWVTSIYTDAEGVGLKYPEGVACSSEGFVVADTGNSRLLRYGYQDESATAEAEFALPKSYPIRLQMNSKGDIYFLDGRERHIVVLSSAGEDKGVLTAKGRPSSSKFVPRSFSIDADDNIYILDIFSEQVTVLDPEGQYLRDIPFPAGYGFFSDVTVDARGYIYLLDSVRAVVYSASNDAEQFSPLTEGLKEYVNFPTSLAADNRGHIFLVDQYGSGLVVISQDGSFLGRKLGAGWKENLLYYPSQICINEEGIVVIADRSNSRVQLFSLVGD